MSLVTWAGFGPFAQGMPDKIASTLVPKARPRDRKHNYRRPARYHICPGDTSHDEPSSEVAVLDHSTNFLFQCIEFCSIRQLFGMGRGPRFHPLGVDFGHGRVFWMGSGGKPPPCKYIVSQPSKRQPHWHLSVTQ